MGFTVQYLYSLTPRQFVNALRGHRRVEERASRDAWERTRMIMWAQLLPHQKAASQLTPVKVLPFPWDIQAAEGLDTNRSAAEEKAAIQESIQRWADLDARAEK